MITVSSDFKTAQKATSKTILGKLTDGVDNLTGADDLMSIKITSEGQLLKTIMRQAKVKYLGAHSYLDSYVTLSMGVVTSVGDEYINYGSFKVIEENTDEATDETEIKLYDKMYESLIKYDLTPTYPITLLQLVQAICTRLGWTLKTTSFTNDSISLESELFSESQLSFRGVLDMVAEASGSIIYFDVDDELVIREVKASDSVLETLTASNLMSLKVQSKYGVINSLVLARTPQEDNIVEQDSASITANGLTELKVENNYIVDADRETYITPIFTVLNDLYYYPFKAETEGLGYFQIGDRIIVENPDATQYEIVIFGIDLTVTGGIKETLYAKIPDTGSTDYKYAGIIGQKITNTQIIVNKQEGEIQIINSALEDDYYSKAEIDIQVDSINSSVETISGDLSTINDNVDNNTDLINTNITDITTLEQRADAIELTVEGIGGTNLLKNSVGLKGDVEEWQELDEDGVPVDADNDATLDISTDVETNGESGSAIRLDEQYIFQTFPTIVGETYTFYMRYKSLEDATLQITGIANLAVSESSDWSVYKYQFVASSDTTTLTLTNVASGTGAYIIMTDLICKLGDASGWVQAPNEVYGKNYRFDKDGFQITSLTDSFKSLLDNQKLAVYDTSSGSDKVVMLVSKDSGIVTSLIAQDELVIQRYENSDASGRFIPTSTGLMLVINNS